MSQDTLYPVQEGDSLESIAKAHGIDYWEDLWEYNKDAVPDPSELRPVDAQGRPLQLKIPDNSWVAASIERLRVAVGDPKEVDKALGGSSWLDPRGLVLQKFVDDNGEPIDGLEVVIRDPLLGTETTVKTVEGKLEQRLPRKDFVFSARIFPGWQESLGFFGQIAEPGDQVEQQVQAALADAEDAVLGSASGSRPPGEQRLAPLLPLRSEEEPEEAAPSSAGSGAPPTESLGEVARCVSDNPGDFEIVGGKGV